MKILMFQERKPYGTGLNDIKVFDVSNDEQMKAVLNGLFKKLDAIGEWSNNLSEAEYGLCKTCNGTWEVKIKKKVFKCPDCKGNSLVKEDWEDAKEFVKLYEKAKTGDLDALKDLIIVDGSSEVRLVEPICYKE